MTQTSLRTVTLKTLANYRHAAERAVGAYRAGGERLIAVMRSSVDQAAQRGAEPYVPGLAAALRRVGDNMGDLATKGLGAVSERSERAIQFSAAGVTAQVKRVADLADGVDNRVVATSLQAAVRISLPGAQAALALSERVASGADKLADVAAGPAAARAKSRAKAASANKSASKSAAQAASRLRRAVKTAAADVGAEVEAVAKPVVRRAKAVKATRPWPRRSRPPPKAAPKAAAKPKAAKPRTSKTVKAVQEAAAAVAAAV
jgi:hypothetical protein